MILQRENHPLATNNGFTLVGVLLVIVVLSVLGLSILMVTSNSVKISSGERDDQSVFYIAEAGVVETVYEINKNVSDAFIEIKGIYNGKSNEDKKKYDFVEEFNSKVIDKVNLTPTTISYVQNLGNVPVASITVTQTNKKPIVFEIESVGKIGDKTRTVIQEITVLEPNSIDGSEIPEGPGIPGNMAVYVNKTIKLSGSVMIYGDVGMKSSRPQDVEFTPQAKATGNLFQGISNVKELPQFPEYPTYNIPPNQVYEKNPSEKTNVIKDGNLLINNYLVSKYTLKMEANMRFKEIVIASDYKLIIDVGNENREIVVDHLNVSQGSIQIIGSGSLTVYVKDKITMGGGSTINNNGDVNKLNIKYKGASPINLGGDQKIYGSLQADSANIKFTAGGGFYGNVSTGGTEVTVDGGANVHTQLFLAPNAKFTLAGGGKIKGAVIADSFIGTGGGSVTFDETNSGNGTDTPIKDYGNGENLIKKEPLVEK